MNKAAITIFALLVLINISSVSTQFAAMNEMKHLAADLNVKLGHETKPQPKVEQVVQPPKVEENEMSKIASSIAGILKHKGTPKPAVAPQQQTPAAKTVTQADIDRMVEELAKKNHVSAPQETKKNAAGHTEHFDELFETMKKLAAQKDQSHKSVTQADIDRMVEQMSHKKNANGHTEHFDELFETMKKIAAQKKTQTPAKRAGVARVEKKSAEQKEFDEIFSSVKKALAEKQGKTGVKPAHQPLKKGVQAIHPPVKKTTQEEFDRLVEAMMKKDTQKVNVPARKPTTQEAFDKLFEQMSKKKQEVKSTKTVSQADIDRMVEELSKKMSSPGVAKTSAPIRHPVTIRNNKKVTQTDIDRMVEQMSKKTSAPVRHPVTIRNNKKVPVTQSDIDRMVEQMSRKNGVAHIESAQESKQKSFDALFEAMEKVAAEKKHQQPQVKGVTQADIDRMVAEMSHQTVAPQKTGLSPLYHAKHETADKFDELVAEMMKKKVPFSQPKITVAEKPVSQLTLAEKDESISCIMSYGELTGLIHEITDFTKHRPVFNALSVQGVKSILEKVGPMVDQVNAKCLPRSRIAFDFRNKITVASTCQQDYQTIKNLGAKFMTSEPGNVQAVAEIAKEFLFMREHMKRNC